MKKLMIAAAAAALSGIAGATAVEDCVACGYAAAKVDKNPAFYDVTFKLKTLAPKKVTCGGCEGWCMEQGNRTINGILWTCVICDPVYPYQLALWEKKGSIQYTDDLVYGPISAKAEVWAFKADYLVTGYYTSEYIYESDALAAQACLAILGFNPTATDQEDIMKYWKCRTCKWTSADGLRTETRKVETAKFDSNTSKEFKDAEPALPAPLEGQDWVWVGQVQGQNENVGLWRFEKNLNNTEAKGLTDGKEYASEAAAKNAATAYAKTLMVQLGAGSAVTLKTVTATKVSEATHGECEWTATVAANVLEWYRYSKKGDKLEAFMAFADNGLELYAAGFGAFDTKKGCPKSISGYAVGKIDPTAVCGDIGNILDICDDFSCGDTCWDAAGVQADDQNTFFTGTWSVKLNNGLTKKTMNNNVPSFYTVVVDPVCAE